VDEPGTTRVTVEEAAHLLGIEKGSVKKRIQRGKIRSEKDATGTTWVYVDTSESVRDESTGRSQTDRDQLLEELRQTNELLREVITTRDEEIRRRDTIIMNMTEAMKALNPPAPEDSSEARESPESSGPTGELEEVREELGAEQARREMAESTLREGMDKERRRREEAERERDDLRQELYALREAPEAPRHECDQRGARGCQKSRAAPSNPLRAHRTARPCYRELPRIHIPRTL
jgi:excisionase family DNA binding protein